MTDVQSREYSASEVATAAEITTSTLQNWLKRGVIIGQGNIKGGGSQGKHRRFSWGNLIEISTSAVLVKKGVKDLHLAFRASQIFAHTGCSTNDSTNRAPAFPFDPVHGETLLIFAGERSRIMACPPDAPIRDLREGLDRPVEAVTVVFLLEVFDRACVSLGIHPQAALDFAYRGTKSQG